MAVYWVQRAMGEVLGPERAGADTAGRHDKKEEEEQ